MFNPVFGAEVRTLQKLSLRASALCSFLGWLLVAVGGNNASIRQIINYHHSNYGIQIGICHSVFSKQKSSNRSSSPDSVRKTKQRP